MEIKWKWGAEEKRKGDEGFNNAGILTFNSHAINSFVRELFQNSNDAKDERQSKIRVKIEYKSILACDIPNFEEYLEILNAVRRSHPNQTKFFRKANEILKNRAIPFLIYSDYNTKGLTGSEEDSSSTFVACVLSEGISAKDNNKTAGGSYGIGKNAIYGVSSLRTVFYSSMDINKDVIFQGVAKLASYKVNEKNHEGRIYLGNGDERLSVRNPDDIPGIFKRSEPGLSQFVMGVELNEKWHNEFTKAILRNYWMLLLEDGLEVELIENGNKVLEINSGNVEELLESEFKNDIDESNLTPYGNPYLFYEAYKKGVKVESDIPLIGECTFNYIESEHGENNIAYMRNGMVVFSKIEKRLVGANVTGVFKCESDYGNEILRKMEPPKHDSFEPQMLEDNHNDYSKKDGDRIVGSIKEKVREIIKSLIAKYKNEIEIPVFLAELFEDLQQRIVDGVSGNRDNEISNIETLYRKAVDEDISISLLSDTDNDYVSNIKGDVNGSGGGKLSGSGPNGNKDSKSKGGRSTNSGGVNRGLSKKYPIRSRVYHFAHENGKNIYKAILHSDSDLGMIELGIMQYGDSGDDIAFQLHSVSDSDNRRINVIEITDVDGFVSEYKINMDVKKGKNSYYLEISDNQKSAFVIKG